MNDRILDDSSVASVRKAKYYDPKVVTCGVWRQGAWAFRDSALTSPRHENLVLHFFWRTVDIVYEILFHRWLWLVAGIDAILVETRTLSR
jgi:hypothetical protein